MIEIGRLCMKIAGRDAGEYCVIVDIIDDNKVVIAGATRNRKCSVKHLELLETVLPVKKGAKAADLKAEFKKLGLEVKETKPKQKTQRVFKARKTKAAAEEIPAEAKKAEKSEKKK